MILWANEAPQDKPLSNAHSEAASFCPTFCPCTNPTEPNTEPKSILRVGEKLVAEHLRKIYTGADWDVVWENEYQERGLPFDIRVVDKESGSDYWIEVGKGLN